MKHTTFIFFLFFQICFAQTGSSVLETQIYNAIDVFVANPTATNLEKLEVIQKKFNPKTQNEQLALVILNCNKAYYQNALGSVKNAITSYEKAWQLFQQKHLKNYDITEFCLKPLGNLYTIIGDYENAENSIKEYFFIANATNNQRQKMAAILNLSNVYQGSGKNDLAIDLLEKTIATEKLTIIQKAVLLNNLGSCYLLISNPDLITKSYNKAENVLKTSIELLKNNTSETVTLSNSYRNLSKLYALEAKFDLAASYFQKGKALFLQQPNQEPRKTAQLYLEEASLLLEQEKLVASSASIAMVFKTLIPNYDAQKTIIPTQQSLYAETYLIDALDLQAQIFLTQNAPKKALDCYRLSFQIEAIFQSILVYETAKIITESRNRNRIEKCIAIYDLLYKKEQKSNYLEDAFWLCEQNKTAVLKSLISDSKFNSRDEKRILEQLQNCTTIILKEQQKLDLANISTINEAIIKQNELMLLLKSKRSVIATNLKDEIGLQQLFSQLQKDNAVMVSYFCGSQKTYCFTLENNEIRMQTLDFSPQSKAKVTRFIDYFATPAAITNDISGYKKAGKLLFDYLKLPNNTYHTNLVIIPDGIVNFVPFEALLTQTTTTTNFAKLPYLLNDFSIGYNSSATFYLNQKKQIDKNETVLGVFPIFENSDFELTFSKKEMTAIKKDFEGKYLEKKQATFENFKHYANQFSILHLSTHATSGDIDVPASIKFYDQEILYSELYNLKIEPNLVVLSACETGLGKWYKAEGAMSVSRGFRMAGAQNLLFSLWKVNDYTTSVFMEKFYSNLKANFSYFEANHNAKLDYLNDNTIPNAKKTPYFWAPMVYYGTLENKSSNNYWGYILAFLGGVGLFFVFRKHKIKRFNFGFFNRKMN